jgi:hypothetical protein
MGTFLSLMEISSALAERRGGNSPPIKNSRKATSSSIAATQLFENCQNSISSLAAIISSTVNDFKHR